MGGRFIGEKTPDKRREEEAADNSHGNDKWTI